MSSTYTSANPNAHSLSLDELERVVKDLEKLMLPDEWMLMSPDGRVWKGDVQKLILVLAPHHPLLAGVRIL
jgi:hypothetical protein